jgi:hypothetical protein
VFGVSRVDRNSGFQTFVSVNAWERMSFSGRSGFVHDSDHSYRLNSQALKPTFLPYEAYLIHIYGKDFSVLTSARKKRVWPRPLPHWLLVAAQVHRLHSKMTSIVSKDKDFLQCFWDLALDNSNARVAASARLIEFVKKNLETERDYALKRLIKGLGSSRDCARHGFATCLTEFLHLPGVSVEHTLEILDNSTKVTGSLKGAEERDFLFSKLFCIMAIIRSKKTVDNKEEHMNLLDRLLELHEQKGWMREVVVEALLLFCSSLTDTAMVNATILKVKTLVSTPIVDMAAWQLSFCIGLAQLQSATHKDGAKIAAVWQKEWKKEAAELEVCKTPLTMDNIESLKDTLLAATAGYPKVRRVEI